MIEYATYCNKYSINTPKIIFPIHIITSQALYPIEENCFEAVWILVQQTHVYLRI